MTSLSAKFENRQDQSVAQRARQSKFSRAIDEDIFASLYTRARAWQLSPDPGSYDEVAMLVLERLGENMHSFCTAASSERRCLVRSQWFDHRCRHFFEKYPTGLCIDLGAGLSTRFHRLCRSADWPRFRWADLDVPEVISLKATVLPRTENYRLVSADLMTDEWLSACGWQRGTPLIITLEGVLMHLPQPAVMHLFAHIAMHCQENLATEIVFDYISPARFLYSRFVDFFKRYRIPYQADSLRRFSFQSGLKSATDIARSLPEFQVLSDCSLRDSGNNFMNNIYQALDRERHLWGYAHLALRQVC